jgi:ATP-binding cassette subfamily B protein
MFKRFLSYYKPHKLMLTVDLLSALFIALIGVCYPIITRNMLNDFIPNKQYNLIVIFGVLLLILYFGKMALNYVMQYYGHMMGVKMQRQMRTDLFKHLQKLPYKYFDENETGKIMTRITSDLFEISELAHHGPENIIISSLSVVLSFTYLLTVHWGLALILFCCVPLLFVVTLILRRRMRSAFRETRATLAEINASVESSISGVRTTKAFNNAKVEMDKFEVGNGAFVNARKKAYDAMGKFHSMNSFITDVFNVVVLIAGGLFLYAGQIGLGDYSAFIVSIGIFINPIMTLINFTEQFQNGSSGFERYCEIMDTPGELDDDGAIDVKQFDGKIEFNAVTHAYNKDNEVLNGVSFVIPKGKTFAFVGPSGGGKTTICHLLPRFYDLTGGEILIDDINIKKVTRSSLRANIGIVQQDVYLFNSSIKDNILYGRPDATDEEVIEASKRANIHDYVMTLEKGYDTVIGERGVKLSGGQKQRLSIARVFLKNPPILILDEATSALDTVTESMIQNSLKELSVGRTTIVVAHRLSTVKNADEIAVVSGGKIVEQGSHLDLIKQGGIYADLYEKQFSDD